MVTKNMNKGVKKGDYAKAIMEALEGTGEAQSAFTVPAALDYQELLKKAREYFFNLDPTNVIGINIAPRRVKKSLRPNEYALVVYVLQKKPLSELDPAKIIPKEFMGLKTDVHAPLSADAPQDTVDFVTEHEISDDLSAIDWVRLHELAVSTEALPIIPHAANVQDFGDICVVQNDGTVVKRNPDGTQYVDFVRAYQLFRTLHGDDYDFVTFFVDTASGMPHVCGCSFWSGIYNDVQGIGLGAFNGRPGWGTSRLQAFHFLNQGHFPIWRYVMLQEFSHQFAAFARYRDPVTSATMTDHLLNGILGHWALNLDDDKSPMGYDSNNWVELPSGQFRMVNLTSDERTYCNLDLYLMGLLGPGEVGEFTLLRNVVPVSATEFTATPVRLNIQNFIAQEGPRTPNVAVSPKSWREAFIVLTNDIHRVHDLVDTIDFLRLRWERDFIEATKGLGRVDTVLDVRSRITPSADFTIVIPVRQGFGNEPGYLNSIEPNVPFVGASKDFTFSCPSVSSNEAAVLMFQSRDVDSSRNILTINGSNVYGGIPVSPNKDTWNGNVMLIDAGILRPNGNVLHIESRNTSGGSGGDIDDFIVDNAVVMYKAR
jgi:hypothetical protein